MRSIRLAAAVSLATCAVVAAPAGAQRMADLAPGAASHARAAPERREIAPTSRVLSASRSLPAALRPSLVDAPDATAARPLSAAGHAGVGAAAGAVTGAAASLAIYAFSPECRSTGSMCGLAFPFIIGGGAVTGGAVGLVVGLVRNR